MTNEDNSRALITVEHRGQSLALYRNPTWGDALPWVGKDDKFDSDCIPVCPDEWERRYPDGRVPSFEIDAALRLIVTPERRAQLTPDQQRRLHSLVEKIQRALTALKERKKSEEPGVPEFMLPYVRKPFDPFSVLETPEIKERLMDMLGLSSIPPEIIINGVAEALARGKSIALGVPCDLNEARGMVLSCVECFRDEHEKEPARPVFESDEYGRMAEHIHERTSATLTAASEREFYIDGAPVLTGLINALIEDILGKCEIFDETRNKHIGTSNRLVAEVRGALARKYLRIPAPDRGIVNIETVKADIVETLPPPAPAAHSALSVSVFANENLQLDEGSWTSSDKLMEAWSTACAQCGSAPGDKEVFLKELGKWGGTHIKRTKRTIQGCRIPGYAGIRLGAASLEM